MALNGVAPPTYLALKYGGHRPAALWMGTVSWQARGALRPVGLLPALDLDGYSFVAPFVPVIPLLPSLVLLPLWITLAGRRLSQEKEQPLMPESMCPAPAGSRDGRPPAATLTRLQSIPSIARKLSARGETQ